MPCTDVQCQASRPVEPSMDRYRARKAKPDHGDSDDSDELGVFTAERYFYGDDALWCERSSSSLSSAFRTATHEHEHDRSVPTPTTAVTSSSEASWNSRSALLPADKLHAAVLVAATPIVEARPSGSGAESESAGRRPASSSNLRRWLLGVASCACAGGAAEESVSADEMEASERFPETESQMAALEEAAAARVAPGSGRWLLGGDQTLAGMEAIQLAVDGHRRATYQPGELFTPTLHPEAAPASDSDERWRIKSLESLPVVVGDHGSALGSSMQSSAFTIVAGTTAPGGDATPAASGGRGSPCEDDAAPSELGCAYPPSEASVVWSVVTADGAASGNFSSAASGYYYYHYYFNDAAMRRAAAKTTQKRRSGFASSSSLLTCMSEKAVDAVGPDRSSVHRQEVQPAAMATRGAAGGNRNVHDGGVYNRQAYLDVIRRRAP